MREQDVLEQLNSYGAWLEGSAATSLRPSAAGRSGTVEGVTGVVVELNAKRQRRPRSRLLWIPMAVAASLLLAFILIQRKDQQDQSTAASVPADPPGRAACSA